MHWFNWVLVAFISLSLLLNIGAIGKERKPITPLGAVVMTIVAGSLITGIIVFRV